MERLRPWLPELAALSVTVPMLGMFGLARMLGAHWNLWFLYMMLATTFGLVLRGVAAWRGWLEPSPLKPEASWQARVHAAVRVVPWLVGVPALLVAVLPIQLGDEHGQVQLMIVVLSLLGITGALMPVRNRPWTATVGLGIVGLVLGWDLIGALRPPAEPTVVLRSPFDEVATVFHGGGSPLVNHHAALQQQHHALDLVLAPDGSEVIGDRTELEGWACFGAPLRAPAAGTVVAVRDDRPDMPIGEVDSEVIVGNHVVVELAPLRYLLLAHLQRGSVEVDEGDAVQSGDLLGRCGNSGNTSQPHLHIQVQSKPGFSNADPELRTFGIRWEELRRNGETRSEIAARRNDELLPP